MEMPYILMYNRTLKEYTASLKWIGPLSWQGLQWVGDVLVELDILEEMIMELGRS